MYLAGLNQTTMKERPILFSGEMVRAILEGRKTQTRRVVKPQHDCSFDGLAPAREYLGRKHFGSWGAYFGWAFVPCPYGQPGDQLWVREACIISPPHWCDRDSDLYNVTDNEARGRICQYIATSPDTDTPIKDYGLKVTPSIHMPRWASRILLEVTDVRVERVQDISEEDARAEGVRLVMGTKDIDTGYQSADGTCLFDSATNAFWTLWDSINAKRGHGWDTNPWVWVVSFKVLEKR